MKSINPKNNILIKEHNTHNSDEIKQAIDATYSCFWEWKKMSFDKKSELLNNVANNLKENSNSYARLITDEMGKPLNEALSEVEKCKWVCEYYAENAKNFLKQETIETDFHKSLVSYEPLGPIFAIMPWNFPFWQVFRFAAPTLMAGNTVILKHAENVTECSLAIENIFLSSGFPENTFKSLLIDRDGAKEVIENPKIQAVTLTGSTQAGKKVAELAGKNLKKTVLELGGNDPYIVLKDANIELAVNAIAKSRLLNSGQSCIAAKRFLIDSSLVEKFEEKLVEIFKKVKMGDPLQRETTLGPLARIDLRDKLHEQVKKSIEKGAQCILGGEIPNREGAFYPPTILKNVRPGMPAFDEELFGPVASLIEFQKEDEAIYLANESIYGLGSAIFSNDIEKAEELATKKIQAGACFINDFVKSDPRLPFGGIKNSGYGRELSLHGIREFVNAKTICVQKSL